MQCHVADAVGVVFPRELDAVTLDADGLLCGDLAAFISIKGEANALDFRRLDRLEEFFGDFSMVCLIELPLSVSVISSFDPFLAKSIVRNVVAPELGLRSTLNPSLLVAEMATYWTHYLPVKFFFHSFTPQIRQLQLL